MKTLLLFLAGIVSYLSFAQDGSPDLSFGNNGVIVSDIGMEGNKYLSGIGLADSGRIIVSGINYDQGADNFIIAYLEDGSIDQSFGVDGIVWTDASNETPKGINVLPDENILVNSIVANIYTIKRLLPNGEVDISFGINGQIQPFITEDGGRLILDNENNLLVLGINNGQNEKGITLKKYDENGVLDSNFGSNGSISHSFGNVSDFTIPTYILKDDQIFIGVNYNDNNISSSNILKLMADGTVDTTFGINGMAIIPIEEEYNTTFSIFQDGSFLVGASYYDINTFDFIRKTIKLFPNAMLDESFGIDGTILGYSGGYIQENQRIILIAHFYDFEGGISLNFSRFYSNGSLDSSFQFESNYYEINSADFLQLDSGKFLIAGCDIWYNSPPSNIILQRFNNNPLSISEFQNQKTTVYPNPSNGIFTIERKLFSEREPYQITDITGKMIAKGELAEKQTQVDLSSAQSGVYFLKTSSGVFRLLKE